MLLKLGQFFSSGAPNNLGALLSGFFKINGGNRLLINAGGDRLIIRKKADQNS